jgi:hypothetical protein
MWLYADSIGSALTAARVAVNDNSTTIGNAMTRRDGRPVVKQYSSAVSNSVRCLSIDRKHTRLRRVVISCRRKANTAAASEQADQRHQWTRHR